METLDISCMIWSEDGKLFMDVIDQGIDSRLEAFTKSTFKVEDGRLHMAFHPAEVPLLLRRLCEVYENSNEDDEQCGLWIEDIMMAQYGMEV